MDLSEKYKIELANFQKAVSSFEVALNTSFDNLNSIGNDLIQNGRIQKFEYCAELAWKISKIHLELFEGILSNSPKGVYKVMFQSALIAEDEYSALLKTIEDRMADPGFLEKKMSFIYSLAPFRPWKERRFSIKVNANSFYYFRLIATVYAKISKP